MHKTADGYELCLGDLVYTEDRELVFVKEFDGCVVLFREVDSCGYVGAKISSLYKYYDNIPDYNVYLENYDRELLRAVLSSKSAQYKMELEKMRKFLVNRWSFPELPAQLKKDTLQETIECVTENIDPWISMIGQVEDLINKFKRIGEY